MDSVYILNNAKKDLQEIIEGLNLHNLDNSEVEVANYFSFLKSLKNLRHYKSEEEVLVCGEDEQIKCSIDEPVVEITPDPKPMYLFNRRPRGGVVPDIEGFVPESVVRNLGLEDGDFVYADELGTTDDHNSRRFNYSFAKIGERNAQTNIIHINYAIVTKVAGSLAVESYLEGSEKKTIRVNEIPYTIVLNESDIIYLSIKEGDVIDLAYNKGFPESHKVQWKHNIETVSVPTIESRSLSYKDINTKNVESEETEVEQSLQGKTILIVGNEPMKAFYKKEIEMRGGNFIFAEPKDKVGSFEPKVRKANQVIFLLKVSSHKGMDHIKALCKRYNKPFDTTWSIGISTVTRMAQSV